MNLISRRNAWLVLLLAGMAAASILLQARARATNSPAVAAAPAATATPDKAALAALGRQLFFDRGLSASGQQACATCHAAARAYGPPNGLPAQFGGADMTHQGMRAVPSLRYTLNKMQAWHVESPSSMMERAEAQELPPTGGLTWDGRFDALHEQATFPLLNPDEMANGTPQGFAERLRHSSSASAFNQLFGRAILNNDKQALHYAGLALAQFQLDDASFHPYSSKFDAWMDGKATLTPQEARGKQLFDDPKSGNCASCHFDNQGANGAHPLFTDYQFEVLGVPRNGELAVNKNPRFFDMGLCGPLRQDQAKQDGYCGMFRTPTLRNVATREVFFHNGKFHDLKTALQFYVQRDTAPQKWYSSVHGKVQKFDDLPADKRANVDTNDEPLTRKRGGTPAWNEQDVDDVIAFLNTLTDRDAMVVAAKK
ncbi:cytochrome-c peroxidase [Amantichitinum ursilacus]|uniref:Methylamine utilization protein MauG n=1 Tax=Amantichitinum ursilacus TaxID=857265 RepID=A0A0N0XLQ4_9NEIS|nr:cytochrome c peroxidase [Amantichitinum ursilacus]KPC55397.1 Methylamine utilization protein MauG precursor [Amantichitinum ursilacus]